MRVALVLLVATGCGRLQFTPVPGGAAGDAGTGDGPSPEATFVSGLPCETDVTVSASIPRLDDLDWVDRGAEQDLFAIHHVDSTHHEIHGYRLTMEGGTLHAVDVLVAAYPDMAGVGASLTPTGIVIAVTRLDDKTTRILALDDQLAIDTSTTLADQSWAITLYAATQDAALLVGSNVAKEIQGYLVGPDLQPTGPAIQIGQGSDSGNLPTVAPAAGGFLVGWDANTTGRCRLARLDASGAITAGPVDLRPTGVTNCSVISGVELADGSVVYTLHDETGSAPVAYAGVLGADLTPGTAPTTVGGPGSIAPGILSLGDRALIPVNDGGVAHLVELDAAGTPTTLGTDFGNGGTLDAHLVAPLAGALLHVRSDAGRLELRKLCR